MAQRYEDIDFAKRAAQLEDEADRLERERSTHDERETSAEKRLEEALSGPLETLRKIADK